MDLLDDGVEVLSLRIRAVRALRPLVEISEIAHDRSGLAEAIDETGRAECGW